MCFWLGGTRMFSLTRLSTSARILPTRPLQVLSCFFFSTPARQGLSRWSPKGPGLLPPRAPWVTCLPACLPGPASLRAYPLLSVITRQPTVISHLVPATPGIAQTLSRHPAAEAAPAEAPGGEALGSSESETEQLTPRQKKPRRSRTIFTELQLMGLEKKFQKQKYLSTPDR